VLFLTRRPVEVWYVLALHMAWSLRGHMQRRDLITPLGSAAVAQAVAILRDQQAITGAALSLVIFSSVAQPKTHLAPWGGPRAAPAGFTFALPRLTGSPSGRLVCLANDTSYDNDYSMTSRLLGEYRV
jgi:hypothetical protein